MLPEDGRCGQTPCPGCSNAAGLHLRIHSRARQDATAHPQDLSPGPPQVRQVVGSAQADHSILEVRMSKIRRGGTKPECRRLAVESRRSAVADRKKSEIRMAKARRSAIHDNGSATRLPSIRASSFELRHSFVIRISSFVIHWPSVVGPAQANRITLPTNKKPRVLCPGLTLRTAGGFGRAAGLT